MNERTKQIRLGFIQSDIQKLLRKIDKKIKLQDQNCSALFGPLENEMYQQNLLKQEMQIEINRNPMLKEKIVQDYVLLRYS